MFHIVDHHLQFNRYPICIGSNTPPVTDAQPKLIISINYSNSTDRSNEFSRCSRFLRVCTTLTSSRSRMDSHVSFFFFSRVFFRCSNSAAIRIMLLSGLPDLWDFHARFWDFKVNAYARMNLRPDNQLRF